VSDSTHVWRKTRSRKRIRVLSSEDHGVLLELKRCLSSPLLFHNEKGRRMNQGEKRRKKFQGSPRSEK